MKIEARIQECLRKARELVAECAELAQEVEMANYEDAPLGELLVITPYPRSDGTTWVWLPRDARCLVDKSGNAIFTRTNEDKWE